MADMRNWLDADMLKVNDEKTEVILFTPKHGVLKHVSVKVGAFDICPLPIVRNLGALFAYQHMIMDKQVHTVCISAYFHLRNISRIQRYLTEPATQILVHSLVTTRLDYCNSLLYSMPRRTLAKLQHVQNAAVCLVARSSHRQHITPVLRQLHWLPVEYRVKFKILLLTFKALHGKAPSYIRDMLHLIKPVRVLRPQCAPTLERPRTRSVKYGDRAFSAAAPALWNGLPAHIRCAKTDVTQNVFLQTSL